MAKRRLRQKMEEGLENDEAIKSASGAKVAPFALGVYYLRDNLRDSFLLLAFRL